MLLVALVARTSLAGRVAVQTTRGCDNAIIIVVICLKRCVLVKGGEVHGLAWERNLTRLCDCGATVRVAVANPRHSMVQIVVLT